eukprot:s627_g47.t1
MSQMPRKISKKAADQPKLNEVEVSMTVGLLTRAVANNQARTIFERTAAEDPQSCQWLKNYIPGFEISGGMSEAAKRVRDDESSHGDSPHSTVWSVVGRGENSLPSGYGGAVAPPTPTVVEPNVTTISQVIRDVHARQNTKISLPEDCADIDDWSKTVIVMKKYERQGYRYSTLVAEAMHNAEAKGYLQWLVKTYGKDADGPCDSQAPDFARFLLRIKWPEIDGRSGTGRFQRSR